MSYSEGQKKRWSKVSKSKRSKIMSKVRLQGWAKKTEEELKEQGMKLVRARKKLSTGRVL